MNQPRVHFTRMDESDRDQWQRIAEETMKEQARVPERVLGLLRSLEAVHGGFGVSQLHHALQTATMAQRANASDELVLAALCHDIGKAISIPNHAEISAALLKKYVSRDTYEIVRTHQDFQGRHYYEHFGLPSTLREQYKDQPWYARAEQFTDEWDQQAFDPAYPVRPLADFAPLVTQFFGQFRM